MALIVFWWSSTVGSWGQGSRVAPLPVHQPQNTSRSWIHPGRAATSSAQKKSAPPSNLSVAFLFLLSAPSPPTSFPFQGATSARGCGGGWGGVLRCAAHKSRESASETAVQISLHLSPPVVKTPPLVIQQLAAAPFHRRPGVTLGGESTSSGVLPGLSPDGRACQQGRETPAELKPPSLMCARPV